MIHPLPPATRVAALIFVDQTECRWLRGLKRGFRHCFTALPCKGGWLVCDPLKNRIELALVQLPPSLDLPAVYAAQGHRVLLGRLRVMPARPRVLAPLTCVEIAKRLVGVRAPLVLTPWQLFCHLQRPTPGRPCWRPVVASDAFAAANQCLTETG